MLCYVRGKEPRLDKMVEHGGVEPPRRTSRDLQFALSASYSLGLESATRCSSNATIPPFTFFIKLPLLLPVSFFSTCTVVTSGAVNESSNPSEASTSMLAVSTIPKPLN